MSAVAEMLGAAKTSSGSPVILIVLVGIVGAVYFLFLRPQQQRQKQQRLERGNAEVGDEILTVGGIVGRVVDVTGDRVTIVTGEETDGIASIGSMPTRLVLVKQGIARKIEPVVHDVEHDLDPEDPSDDDEDGYYVDAENEADDDGHDDGHEVEADDDGHDDAAGDDGPARGTRGR